MTEELKPSAQTGDGGIHVVVQRCVSARLLVDAVADTWVDIGRGLILYVSFSQSGSAAVAPSSTATETLLRQVARSLLAAPLSSSDKWHADHSDAESVVTLCSHGEAQSILVVPQASLVSKLQAGDKNLKYHQQCKKDDANILYHSFVKALQSVALELIAGPAPKHDPDNYKALKAKREAASLISPDQFFKTGEYAGKYSRYDERGVPTHDADGVELPKSALKKLEKFYTVQVKKYAKAAVAAEGGDGTEDPLIQGEIKECPAETGPQTPMETMELEAPAAPALPEGACLPEVRHGTFGGRQGFEMKTGGPLTHMFVF